MKTPLVKTATMTSRGQLTIPAAICRELGIKPGTKLTIYPIGRGAFSAMIKRPSRILEFAGDLAALDRRLREKEEPKR